MRKASNLLTDVTGLRVGNAHDAGLLSGVTVVLSDAPAVCAVDVRGGGPGTRETDALSPTSTVAEAHAIVLSGGSAFGLAAAGGVQEWLAERGVGFAIGGARVPIAPQAILFDLAVGGAGWARPAVYHALARQACEAAKVGFELGSVGAGYGATCADLRGGLGSASLLLDDGLAIGALAAVNAAGQVTIGDTPSFWAAPFEQGDEFGGRGLPRPWPADALNPKLKRAAAASTTLAVVATNARLTKAEAHRLAVMAQTGLARAVYPVHTPLDGDIVFVLATGEVSVTDPLAMLARLGTFAANVVARAIARAVYDAAPPPGGWQGPPDYRTRFKERS